MENFGKFMVLLLAMIISPIVNGFVFSKLWAWFIVSTFGANPLRIIEAIGIIFLINFACAKREKTDTDDFWNKFGDAFLYMIIYAAFALLVGWIAHLFY